MSSLTCIVCSKPIAGQYAIIEGAHYHAMCFVCANCKSSLAQGYFKYLNQLYCEQCHLEKTAPKCPTCLRPIAPGKHVKAANQDYHSECLICRDCKKRIEGKSIYPVRGHIYCINCHFARKIESEGLK